MRPSRKLLASARTVHGSAPITLALLTSLLFLLTVSNTPPPKIQRQYGETTIDIRSDRAWTFFPGDCVKLSWNLEGIESLHIDRGGQIGSGEMPFCPAINATSPLIEIVAKNGIYRAPELKIQHLPDLLFYLVGFVGVCGTALLALHYLRANRLNDKPPLSRLLVASLILACIGASLRLAPHTRLAIDADDGKVAIRFWTARDSMIFPHECLDVAWSVIGAESARFLGNDVSLDQNPGYASFCASDGAAATLEVFAEDGARYEYNLPVSSLFPHPLSPPAPMVWSLLWLILALVIFSLLMWQGLRRNWRNTSSGDKIAAAACLLFPIALYLPFGFQTSAHWENWILHGYMEGGPPSFFDSWVVTRFGGLVHRVLAYIISPESFLGYNLVNCLMHSAMTAVVYGILRQGRVRPLYAFLMALLFIVYPVNPMQLSMRSLLLNYSKLHFLAAIFLALEFRRLPRKLTLCGMWLALTFSVNSYESGMMLVLLVPLLWCLANRDINWRKLNLTAIWLLPPALKLSYIALLSATGRDFYQSGLLDSSTNASAAATNAVSTFVDALGWVYPFTFFGGWQEAIQTIERNHWWLPTIIPLASAAAVAWLLARQPNARSDPTSRQLAILMLLGLLLIIPAIGVLMWIPLYNNDPWRMCLYVPIGAVIALFSAMLLLTNRLPKPGFRNAAVVAASLLLLLPAVSRLFLQHEQFVESASKKSNIIHNVIALAPKPHANAHIALITELDHQFLESQDIFDLLNRDMLYSALYTLYQSNAPEYAYFCVMLTACSYVDDRETLLTSSQPEDLLARTLVFKLNADLSVELVEDPAAFLNLDIDIPYDASQLYQARAPLPPRINTMLPARRHT